MTRSISGSSASASGLPYALVSAGSLYVEMADFAASVLLFKSALRVILEHPIGLRRAGRWAEEAHDVMAEEERPIKAARTGRVGWDILN